MSARRLFAVSATALLTGLGLAAPAAAHASVRHVAVGVTEFSVGRLGATIGGLLGLVAVVIAVLALTRPAGRLGVASGAVGAVGAVGAKAAVVAALIATTLGGMVAATADGGLGTGDGLGGAYVALLLGLIGTGLGWRALSRSRRTG
ncbi:DUF6223 family protein [Streptomyces sp. NBC_01244]|uniref:DUF6223 family protein n=1 Tax=Streptomyces sp. NBC_01244 TaxID=2903797 RepID=UPI002E108E48|nr:DUF6223 family protein [Streptomyces sp. NBC_01244]